MPVHVFAKILDESPLAGALHSFAKILDESPLALVADTNVTADPLTLTFSATGQAITQVSFYASPLQILFELRVTSVLLDTVVNADPLTLNLSLAGRLNNLTDLNITADPLTLTFSLAGGEASTNIEADALTLYMSLR